MDIHNPNNPHIYLGKGPITDFVTWMGGGIARHPKRVLATTVFLILMFSTIAFVAVPFELKQVPFVPTNDVSSIRADAFSLVRLQGADADAEVAQGSVGFGSVSLLYTRRPDTADSSIIGTDEEEEAAIAAIKRLESTIIEHPDWTKVCKRSSTFGCDPPLSLVSFLYPPDGTGAAVPLSVLNTPQVAPVTGAILSEDFNNDTLTARYARSTFFFGTPVEGFTNPSDDLSAQVAVRNGLLDALLDEFSPEPTDIQAFYAGVHVTTIEANSYLISDSVLSSGSWLAVFAYMSFHTWSFKLSSFGMLNILSSFPISYCVFRVFLGLRMTILNFLSLFLLLGIGADNVFILVDTWKHGRTFLPDSYEGRMTWTFTRSSKAMFVTTLTTATSFLASGFSAIPAIQNFGFFAATIVFVNFLLICVFFYPILCLYEHSIERRRGRILQNKADVAAGVVNADGTPGSAAPKDGAPPAKRLRRGKLLVTEFKGNSADNAASRMDHWLANHFVPALYKARYVVLILIVSLAAVMAFFGLGIKPRTTADAFLPDDSFLTRFFEISDNSFATLASVNSATLGLVWGVDGLDRSTIDPDVDEDVGTLQLDPNFDFFDNQVLAASACSMLTDDPDDKLAEGATPLCPLELFLDWCDSATGAAAGCVSGPAAGTSPPVPVFTGTRTGFAGNLSAWANDPALSGDAVTAARLVGLDADGTTVLWTAITASLALPSDSIGSEVRPEFDYWEEVMAELNNDAPDSWQGWTTSQSWVRMVADETMVSTALFGIFTGAIIAGIVLLSTTRDGLVSLFSMLTIFSIVTTLMGFLVLFYGGLGFSESLLLTVTVGLAVDYTVHLGQAYLYSPGTTRLERTRDAFEHIGASIVGGATTTILAAIFLLSAQISTSSVVGQMILLTIALSFFYTFTMFSSLILVAGPTPSQFNCLSFGHAPVPQGKSEARVAAAIPDDKADLDKSSPRDSATPRDRSPSKSPAKRPASQNSQSSGTGSPEVPPELSPEVVPEVSPEVVPELSPEVPPELSPEVVPEVSPEVVPELSPEVVPELSPEVSPEVLPEVPPQVPPEV